MIVQWVWMSRFFAASMLTAIEDDVRKIGTETPVQIFFVNVGAGSCTFYGDYVP